LSYKTNNGNLPEGFDERLRVISSSEGQKSRWYTDHILEIIRRFKNAKNLGRFQRVFEGSRRF